MSLFLLERILARRNERMEELRLQNRDPKKDRIVVRLMFYALAILKKLESEE